MKYLGINLIQHVQEDNYKNFIEEINKKLNKWRDIAYSWVGRFNIVKMSIFLNLI